MTELEKELRADFKLFKQDKSKYEKKVNSVSDIFCLPPVSRLRGDYLSSYIVGNYEDNENDKYVLISLNPGFKENMNGEEEKLKLPEFDNYMKFILNFFKLVQCLEYCDDNGKKRKFSSPYYSSLRPYIGKLVNKHVTKDYNQFDMYNDHLINIDLVPYHSSSFSYKRTDESDVYLRKRMDSILEFIRNQKNIKGIIFNGKCYYEIIKSIYPGIIFNKNKINKYNDVYLFELSGIKCIQHKFLNRRGSHLTNIDKEKIADLFLRYKPQE